MSWGTVRPPLSRRGASLLVAGLMLALLLVACDDDPDPAATDPAATDPAATQPTGASADTTPLGDPDAPDPNDPAPSFPYTDPGVAFAEPGDSVTLDFPPSLAVWAPAEDIDQAPGAVFSAYVYRRESDELWALTDPQGLTYQVSLIPGRDALIGVTAPAYSGPSPQAYETVLVDLTTGEVTQLLPFEAGAITQRSGVSAGETGVLELVVDRTARLADDRRVPSGFYTLALDSGLLTYRSVQLNYPLGQSFPLDVPLPDSSYWPGATMVEMRPLPDTHETELVWVNGESGEERVIADRMSGPQRSPDGRWLGYVDTDHRLTVLELGGIGDHLVLTEPGWWGFEWSPDGRYLYGQVTILGRSFGAIWDFETFVQERPRQVGLFDDIQFGDWRSDTGEALLLRDACMPGGFSLDRFDLTTGESQPVPGDLAGFWHVAWSPQGDVIAGSSVEMPIVLIDPASGVILPTPGLDMFTHAQYAQWSDSGQWLLLANLIRERCF